MERIACIDLGSNSVRFVVTEIQDNGSYRLIYQEKESIRLSEGLLDKQELTPAAMGRAIYSLKAFSHMAKALSCTSMEAVATAAVRQANNSQYFLDLVKAETGITIRVIGGEDEAYLGYLGVVNTIDCEDFVLFDLGGASVEISVIKGRELQHSVSLPIGALTLTAQFQKGKEMSEDERLAMCKHIRKMISNSPVGKIIEGKTLIGVGGTARNLAKMHQRLTEYPITKLHNYGMRRKDVEAMYEMIYTKKLEQRRKIPGLSQERADIIIAGVSLINELLKVTKAKEMIVSGCGLREGLFYDYYGKHYGTKSGSLIPDILQHSACNVLLSTVPSHEKHAYYVSTLSQRIFKVLSSEFSFTKEDARILNAASLLHDTGKCINYYSHARHSGYMIVNSNLYGLSHRQQAMCGFVATFSHGVTAKLIKQSPYGALLREADHRRVYQLAAILAIAEAIDESHEQAACYVSVAATDSELIIDICLQEGRQSTIAAIALDKVEKLVRKELKKKLTVRWTN